MTEVSEYDPYALPPDAVQEPPASLLTALWKIGPGIILAGLGPDALNIEGGLFTARLSGHHRQIKPLLLDQGCLAGIGNIYADESLFRAGIHPQRLSSSLSNDEMHRLYRAVRSVLEEAVSAHGANIDGVFKAGSFIVSV